MLDLEGRSTTREFIVEDIRDLLDDPSEWSYDPTRGAYRDVWMGDPDNYNYNPGLNIPPQILPTLQSVTCTFTCYYNTPAESLGSVAIRFMSSGVIINEIGVYDNHTQPPYRQTIYGGDEPSGNVSNIVNRALTWTIPTGTTIDQLAVNSAAFVENNPSLPTYGKRYPASIRGLRNLVLKF